MKLTYKDLQRIYRKADNWDKLKKWLEDTENYLEGEYKTAKSDLVYRYYRGAKNAIGDTLMKMKDLEN